MRYGPETASDATEGKEEKRMSRPVMNAEAEGGKLSSQIKTDEYTAWTMPAEPPLMPAEPPLVFEY